LTSLRLARIDVLLLLMTLIWGVNYSIVKHAFRELHPQAFNALRMTIASFVFLVVIAVMQWRRVRPRPDVAPTPERSIGSIFHTPARIRASRTARS
jgi:drug/metabolite transporter (DMT)-like permease